MPTPDPPPTIKTPWASATPPSAAGAGAGAGEAPPILIPDHTLIRRVGKGNYGEVWLARNVLGGYRAVKIIQRRSFDDDRPFEREFAGMQRFEPVSRSHESQLNILQVGRGPDCFYYVMELADDMGRGAAIDEASYTPRNLRSEILLRGRLPVAECIRLGLALSTALENLHRHGLVHRDIKPSNIVFVNGIPKLADIGLVAVAEATMSFVGTEGYLPPEGPGTVQADLFSLGKVLYEISTGHDRNQFPELPTGISELPDRAELSELNEVLLRACAPDVKERYQTAAELHADLALLHSGRSVLDQRQLERRLRFVTRFAMVLVAVLVLGVLPYYWAIQSARRAKLAAKQATNEAAKNREVADFLRKIFESVRQSVTLGQDTAMVKGILDRAKVRVSRDLQDQPEVQADLLNTIGNISFDLGEAPEAIEALREALRLRRALFGETNLLVAESLVGLGAALEMQGEGRKAEMAMGQALAIRRKLLGDDHPEVARTLSNYGTLIRSRPAEAEAAHREALRRLQRHFPEGSADVAAALDNLGLTLKVRGKLTEGEQIARESLEMWRKLTGDENADVATAWTRLGVLVSMQDKNEEAEPLLREGYRQRRKFFGVDHPYTGSALASLAGALNSQGKFAEAEQLLREHLSMRKKREVYLSATVLWGLALSLAGQGKFTEAQAAFREKAELELKQLSQPPDGSNPAALNSIAWCLATSGEPTVRDGPRAVELAGQAVAATARTNASFLDTLAAAYAETGQFDQAVATQQEAMGVLQEPMERADYASRLELYVAGQPYHEPGFKELVADPLAGIISSLLQSRKFTAAETPARALVVFLQKEWPEDWRTFNSQSQLGGSLLGQKKYAEAEPLLLSGYAGLKQREDQIPVSKKSLLGEALRRLVHFYQATQQPDAAASWQAKLDEHNRAAAKPTTPPGK